MRANSYLFIINPISGCKKDVSRLIALINSIFHEKEFQIKFTEYAGHASELAAEAAKRNIDIVTFAGGDGTLNETASGLVNTDTALGIIPRGSGNGFARSLGIPLKTKAALELLLNPEIICTDVGKINDAYFFGVAGVGFDAVVGRAFQTFGHRGPLPYFYIGLKEFFKYTYSEITIETEEETRTFRPLTVTFANTSQYGNGAQIAPMADFADGFLNICIIDRFSLIKGVRGLGKLFNGRIAENEFYHTFKSRSLKIRNGTPQGLFHTDGEPRSAGRELNISLLPKALKVVTNLK